MKRILVVEGDTNQRRQYVNELAGECYGVLSAANGEEALKIFGECHPDLVVLDLNMPKMDGLDLLGRLIWVCPQLPVIVHTTRTAFEVDSLGWPADGSVRNSTDLLELKQLVAEALARPDFKNDITERAA